MAVEDDSDRLAFVDPDEFGAVATFTLSDGSALPDVPGIYDAHHVTKGLKQNNQFSYSHGEDTSGQKPEFLTPVALIPGVKNGRASVVITHDGIAENFTVYDVKPDGTGFACIRLMRA